MNKNKYVVYQVFTRLFGNKRNVNKAWGTKEENGVGKFSDFTDTALTAIKELGVSHIWYTGVPHHALIGDYTRYGIENDHPAVVKDRAGTPCAKMGIVNGKYKVTECINGQHKVDLVVKNPSATLPLSLPPLASFAYILEGKKNA